MVGIYIDLGPTWSVQTWSAVWSAQIVDTSSCSILVDLIAIWEHPVISCLGRHATLVSVICLSEVWPAQALGPTQLQLVHSQVQNLVWQVQAVPLVVQASMMKAAEVCLCCTKSALCCAKPPPCIHSGAPIYQHTICNACSGSAVWVSALILLPSHIFVAYMLS